jgi:subtilisin family serine protease
MNGPCTTIARGGDDVAGSHPLTVAANFDEVNGLPVLDLVFDNSGHGTHVAGIAAGHNLFRVAGFDGVAPGAQVIGLKIANNARGGVSVTGSMQRAMTYAARFAEARGLPLVLNLSFGLGNEVEGRAVIDSIINAFLIAHPSVVFTISAGNDGPGCRPWASAPPTLRCPPVPCSRRVCRSPYAAGPRARRHRVVEPPRRRAREAGYRAPGVPSRRFRGSTRG